jgi:hypothetical protein
MHLKMCIFNFEFLLLKFNFAKAHTNLDSKVCTRFYLLYC